MARGGRLGRVGLVVAVLVAGLVPLAAVGVGVALLLREDDPPSAEGDAPTEQRPVEELVAELPEVQPLPYGLEQVEGTVAVGRPVLSEEDVALRAVYRVTAEDPIEVFQAWLDQIARVTAFPIQPPPWTCERFAATPARWCAVSHGGELELWMTDDGPLLLVDLNAPPDEPAPGPVEVGAFEPGAPPSEQLPWVLPTAGEPFIQEQGSVLRLPPGTVGLVPTVPRNHGAGNTYALFAASDAEAALADLARQARGFDGGPEVTGPERSVVDGVTYDRATFYVPAGGPLFEVTSIRAADDPVATVYVESFGG